MLTESFNFPNKLSSKEQYLLDVLGLAMYKLWDFIGMEHLPLPMKKFLKDPQFSWCFADVDKAFMVAKRVNDKNCCLLCGKQFYGVGGIGYFVPETEMKEKHLIPTIKLRQLFMDFVLIVPTKLGKLTKK